SAICLATIAGSYNGSSRIEVPTATRSVTADSRARFIIASGEGLREAMWPPVHSESIGSCSIADTSSRSAPATNPIWMFPRPAPRLRGVHASRAARKSSRCVPDDRYGGGAALVEADDPGRLGIGVEAQVREPREERFDRRGDLRARQVLAQTDMRPPPEGEIRARCAPGVELVRAVPARRVATCCSVTYVDDGSLRDHDSAELRVLVREAREYGVRGRPTRRLLDDRAEQRGIPAQGIDPLGAFEQCDQRDPHLLPRGARSRGEQQPGEGEDVGVGENVRLAVLVRELGLDEHADQVALRARAPRLADGSQDLDQTPRATPLPACAHGCTDVERIFDRDPEASADREQRDRGTELDVQVRATARLERVDQRVNRRADPFLGPPPH